MKFGYRYFLIKDVDIGCFRKAARHAQKAFGEINTALSKEPLDVPRSPVSCAATLAKKWACPTCKRLWWRDLQGCWPKWRDLWGTGSRNMDHRDGQPY